MSEPRAPYRVTYVDQRAVSGALRREAKRLVSMEPGRYDGPKPELIQALIDRQGWSQTDVADTLRVNVSTVRRWCAGREQRQSVEIPFAAWWLLLLRSGFVSVVDLDSSSLPTDQRRDLDAY